MWSFRARPQPFEVWEAEGDPAPSLRHLWRCDDLGMPQAPGHIEYGGAGAGELIS